MRAPALAIHSLVMIQLLPLQPQGFYEGIIEYHLATHDEVEFHLLIPYPVDKCIGCLFLDKVLW
jgi:hypothetical protein